MYLSVELIHALQPSERRAFNRREAASYVGVSPGTFDKLVRRCIMPPSIEFLGRKVWDKMALDTALDELSGIARNRIVSAPALSPESAFDDQLDQELNEFRASHGHA